MKSLPMPFAAVVDPIRKRGMAPPSTTAEIVIPINNSVSVTPAFGWSALFCAALREKVIMLKGWNIGTDCVKCVRVVYCPIAVAE